MARETVAADSLRAAGTLHIFCFASEPALRYKRSMENKEIIKKALLFSGLAEEHLVEVAGIAVRRPFAKGETLFTEGEKAQGFYLLAQGSLKLCKISPDGREKVLHMVHPVETFAEAAFFGDGSYPAEARGVEKGEVLFFPRESFMGLLERNPRFSLNLIASLSLLLRRFARQIEELSFADAPARLASYLIDLAARKSTNFQARPIWSSTCARVSLPRVWAPSARPCRAPSES